MDMSFERQLDLQPVGDALSDVRTALQKLIAEFDSHNHDGSNSQRFNVLEIISAIISNIAIVGSSVNNPAGTGVATPIGFIGKDPQSQNIWGFIAERGYGFHARYTGANYARMFVDATNDNGHTTPSVIWDLPSPNKGVLKDNESHTLIRYYGRGGREVGNPQVNFNAYGAFDLFCPARLFTFDYNGASVGGPETNGGNGGCYAQDGFMYARLNYGSSRISDIRVFIDGRWRSVSMTQEGSKYALDLTTTPVAETVLVKESVTITVT